uniref:Minor capsid protein P8 central region domain-containing protein n=1 Tax=viral metagenome TaxID=1070528 RepID=A0A6C0AVB6_9ZZZZ|tara:strand:+ start:372 stop:929 length:558 start_codon:yes stop_codon:yes gene_type:complete
MNNNLWKPNNYNQEHKILPIPTKANGRVDIIPEASHELRFKMQEKIALKNNATEYREALTGNWESTLLSRTFFSAENIQILQNGIRAGVHKESEGKILVPPQNVDTLKIIMRSTFLQYSENREEDIKGQIVRLNKIVLDYCIPSVYQEAVGYVKYIRDQSTLVVPMERPKNNDRDYKELEFRQFM